MGYDERFYFCTSYRVSRISRVVLAELPSRHPELLVGFGSLDGKGLGAFERF